MEDVPIDDLVSCTDSGTSWTCLLSTPDGYETVQTEEIEMESEARIVGSDDRSSVVLSGEPDMCEVTEEKMECWDFEDRPDAR